MALHSQEIDSLVGVLYGLIGAHQNGTGLLPGYESDDLGAIAELINRYYDHRGTNAPGRIPTVAVMSNALKIEPEQGVIENEPEDRGPSS
jgi:hypothetical protein